MDHHGSSGGPVGVAVGVAMLTVRAMAPVGGILWLLLHSYGIDG